MNKSKILINAAASLLFFFVAATTANAQATRTWVSGVGDDVNPCSRTAPCKTFAGAISKTATGGEISVLDPGGFGTLNITKSITVDGGGIIGSTLAAGTTGFIINITNAADTNARVVLRNLSINGATTGTTGIRFLAGNELHVENCVIFGFNTGASTGFGIDFAPAGTGYLFVRNTVVRDNGTNGTGGGIFIRPGVSGAARVTLDGVQMSRNNYGLRTEDRAKVTVRNSIAAGNFNNGFIAFSAGVGSNINLESTVSANNGSNGVSANGANAIVRLSNTTITDNEARGIFTNNSGQVISFSNNRLAGNVTGDGTPTSTVGQN